MFSTDLKCNFVTLFTVSAFTALQATFLLTLQCARRFYETQYIQVFSKQAKINFVHYLVGYLHYFGAFLAIISQAPGFVRNPQPEDLTYIHIDMVFPRNLSMMLVFFLGWYQQLRANLMLANLRKNRSGNLNYYLIINNYFAKKWHGLIDNNCMIIYRCRYN